jgi:hypothetical protein
MKITKEDTPLPESVAPHTCSLVVFSGGDPEHNPRSFAMMVPQVEPHTLLSMRGHPSNPSNRQRGTPVAFAITGDKNAVLGVWPAPDATLHAVFRYCPVMRQI